MCSSMPCLCDCLYTGPYDGKCARCVVYPLLWILFIAGAILGSPYIVIGLIGMCIFYIPKRLCEDCWCDTFCYYSFYKMWTTWPDWYKYIFSRKKLADEPIY